MAYKNFDLLLAVQVFIQMILGHSDLILKNLVKGHIELPYATTMFKQTNSAARFCKKSSRGCLRVRMDANADANRSKTICRPPLKRVDIITGGLTSILQPLDVYM